MPDVLTEREDGLAVLTFNRPERLNAIGGTMLPELAEAIPALVGDPQVRAIMITGAGRAFCAGVDITSMGGGGSNVRGRGRWGSSPTNMLSRCGALATCR